MTGFLIILLFIGIAGFICGTYCFVRDTKRSYYREQTEDRKLDVFVIVTSVLYMMILSFMLYGWTHNM